MWEILFYTSSNRLEPMWGEMGNYTSLNGNKHFFCQRKARAFICLTPEGMRRTRYILHRVGEPYNQDAT